MSKLFCTIFPYFHLTNGTGVDYSLDAAAHLQVFAIALFSRYQKEYETYIQVSKTATLLLSERRRTWRATGGSLWQTYRVAERVPGVGVVRDHVPL